MYNYITNSKRNNLIFKVLEIKLLKSGLVIFMLTLLQSSNMFSIFITSIIFCTCGSTIKFVFLYKNYIRYMTFAQEIITLNIITH